MCELPECVYGAISFVWRNAWWTHNIVTIEVHVPACPKSHLMLALVTRHGSYPPVPWFARHWSGHSVFIPTTLKSTQLLENAPDKISVLHAQVILPRDLVEVCWPFSIMPLADYSASCQSCNTQVIWWCWLGRYRLCIEAMRSPDWHLYRRGAQGSATRYTTCCTPLDGSLSPLPGKGLVSCVQHLLHHTKLNVKKHFRAKERIIETELYLGWLEELDFVVTGIEVRLFFSLTLLELMARIIFLEFA